MVSTRRMRAAGAVLAGMFCLGEGTATLAQFFPKMPKMPGSGGSSKNKHNKNNDSGVNAPGVPVPMDHPIVQSFLKLEQQKVYHQRMSMPDMDPQMASMMAQFGITPAETTVAGDVRLVTMQYKMQAFDRPGQFDDWTILAVSKNGRAAHKLTSPAVPRILAYSDAQFAKQMAELNKQAAGAVSRSLTQGPLGLIGAGMEIGMTALGDAMAPKLLKKSHEMFEWKCDDRQAEQQAPADRSAPPPFTDAKRVGHTKIDGLEATTYEFFIQQNGQAMGPMKMHITNDSGLPLRIEMSDKRMPGTMRMDYFGFGQGGDIEVPACLEK